MKSKVHLEFLSKLKQTKGNKKVKYFTFSKYAKLLKKPIYRVSGE